ncbi:hypothetical protein NA56DRAFT_672343 [Hyaloscypha hepaticicola]|uniref:Glycosyltransferase 2-like domain-containing protein n=1 Tax=Hyaloscypha hepaticicola TaxID=2082293 RepID=A0A2J6PWW7_9HELO|nr:hypothetical protein NA56DRAFT_672343 [Hyaloscypha hepaticicola]
MTNSQLVLVYYTIFVHVLGLLFPIRLCWAVKSMTTNLKRTQIQAAPLRKLAKRIQFRHSKSESGYEDSLSSDYSESDVEVSTESEYEDELLVHAIILPNYKEEMDTLRETLEVLASHQLARSSYEIYLAVEAGEAGAAAKANILVIEFSKLFRLVEFTMHPRDIPGEAQGKSSNLCWAARYINGKHTDEKSKQNIIVTVIDSDSHLSTNYFSLINNLHYAYPVTADNTMYVPPIIFDRNAHLVPRLVRVADLLWAGAGLSGHYKTSSICPPTSVYSLPLSLVDKAGGWDAGEDAIGEDLHMYIKCFFAVNGNLTTRSVFAPASHSNVHSSGKGIRGFFGDINARYKQAMRHMWGALDSGFVLKNLTQLWWAKHGKSIHWTNTFVLLHRMFEAHFLPIHITLLLLISSVYTLLTPSSQIPRLLLQTLSLTGYIRLLSALQFIYFFFLYESYHSISLSLRQTEMVRAGLSNQIYSRRSWKTTGLDFCCFPVAGILFGSLPASIALVCQFWTTKLVYRVSKKPGREVSPA